MAKGCLKIATCQFAVSASITRNSQQICAQMQKAKKGGADIAHFPECALSGYIGFDFPNFDGFDWDTSRKGNQQDNGSGGEIETVGGVGLCASAGRSRQDK